MISSDGLPGPASLSFLVESYPDGADALIEFRNQNRPTARDRAYFDWRFLARPCRLKPVTVWAVVKDRRVGALTVFPHDYYVLDAEYPVGVLGDISVLPEYRGKGIAGQLFRFLPQIGALRPLLGCLVLPNEDAARALIRADWVEIQRVGRLLHFLDVSPRVRGVVRNERLAGILARPLNWAIRAAWSWRPAGAGGRFRGTVVADLDERFDELWRRVDKRGRIVGLRDRRYLNWRFLLHPAEKYQVFALTESERLCGYIMYRQADGTCYVEDTFCLDDETCSGSLLTQFVRHVRDAGSIATIAARVNQSFLRLPWRRAGFVRRPDYQGALVPRQLEESIRKKGGGAAAWHLTGGDKDV